MYAVVEWANYGNKIVNFFVKRIDLDLIIEKIISIIFIAVLMYFSIRIS